MRSMLAPASPSVVAAASTARATSGSVAIPAPASVATAIRAPATRISRLSQSRSCGGRLMKSASSGRESTAMARAASATVRVRGPTTRA